MTTQTTETYDKLAPTPSIDSQPYWDGLKEHKLKLQKCANCGKIRHYPRPVCDSCWSMEVDWIEASGKGTVHSWTVSHHAFLPAYKKELPLILVTVDLEEGVRMNSQLRDSKPEDLKLGMPVEVIYEDATDDLTLPMFRPAR